MAALSNFSFPRLCVFSLLVGCAAAEDKESSWMGMAIASTLMGCIFFQMGLFYIVNDPNPAMRRHAYDIINQTIAIFSSVLIFQSFADQVEYRCLHGEPLETQAVVDMMQMLFWYALLQLTLAWICGALGKDTPDKLEVTRTKTSVKHWSILLSHITGFSAINAWGSVQQLELFRGTPLMCLLVVALSFAGQWLLFTIMYFIRRRITDKDHEREELRSYRESRQVRPEWESILKLWEEETEESENDIMALTLSFNATQVIRYHIIGSLPNQEGEENEIYEAARTHESTKICTIKLIGVSILSAIALFIFYTNVVSKPAPEADLDAPETDEIEHARSNIITTIASKTAKKLKTKTKRMKDKAKLAHEEITAKVRDGTKKIRQLRRTSTQYSMSRNDAVELSSSSEEEEEVEEEKRWKVRLYDMAILSLSMTFSWCMFFAFEMYLRGSDYVEEPMLQAVVLPLSISFLCLLSIRGLQSMVELECTDERADKATTEIIKAFAILIGFSWERCFDAAVTVIASRVQGKEHSAKFFLAFGCVAVVLPAWKRHLLPMVLKDGWRFGFVIEADKPKKWRLVVKSITKVFKKHYKSRANPQHPDHMEEDHHRHMHEMLRSFTCGTDILGSVIATHRKRIEEHSGLSYSLANNDSYVTLAGSEEESVASSSRIAEVSANSQIFRDFAPTHEHVHSSADDSEVQRMRRRITHLERALSQVLDSLQEKEARDVAHSERFREWYARMDLVCHGSDSLT